MTDSKDEQDMLQYTAPVSEYTIRDSRPANTIRFYNGAPDNTEVMRISQDGIWANPDVPTDEAAKKVLEALSGYLKPMLDNAVEQEREACAKVADEWPDYDVEGLAKAIRVRGQA